MKNRTRSMLIVPLVSALVTLAPFAQAQEPRRETHPREGHVDFHGREYRHFNEHELVIWRGGRWLHEWHNGHYGWWWEVAGVWYFYPAPVYPYPTSVPVVALQPVPTPPVQREVVYPHGKYVLYGDGVTQPWQWVWVSAASSPPSPPAPPPPAGTPPPPPPAPVTR